MNLFDLITSYCTVSDCAEYLCIIYSLTYIQPTSQPRQEQPKGSARRLLQSQVARQKIVMPLLFISWCVILLIRTSPRLIEQFSCTMSHVEGKTKQGNILLRNMEKK